ncbi:MAG: 16S rRNA (guanine(966)-N(2))-methyltransferase RsmD [Betaproteobacteria bacterium]
MAKTDAARQRQAASGANRAQAVKRPEPSDHTVRIVGGRWKRSRLPVANKAGLRPTPDRVRETVFNWLGQDLAGWSCFDAFAGTGALGFEAASRGATAVTLVEQDRALVLQLVAAKERLGADMVQIQRGDGVSALARLSGDSMDLVLLDPPFDADLYEPSLRAAAGAVRPGAFVYLEAPTAWSDAMLGSWGLTVVRHLKAGAVHAHLLRKSEQVPRA